MLWSGSSPVTVLRDSMWGLLMFAGVAWLAIAWSVLRLEPVDVVGVAGPVLFFGALCEAVRALAATRTWWLNAGMGVLFAATGVIVLVDRDSTWTTPASLVGWFLMVRGAMDIAVSTMNRGVDRTWGLLLSLGVVQAGLGFFASSPLFRTADLVIVTLGAVGLLRSVCDLVTALRLREVAAARHDVLQLPPEREAGLAGYSAGRTDYEDAPAESRARHRAEPDRAEPDRDTPDQDTPDRGERDLDAPTFHDEVVRTTKDLDRMIAQAGVTGTGAAASRVPAHLPPVPDYPAEVTEPAPRAH